MKRSSSLHAQSTSTSPASDTFDPNTLATGYISSGIANSPSSLCGNTTIAKAGDGASPASLPGQSPFTPDHYDLPAAPVPGVASIDGWTLWSAMVPDSDGFEEPMFFARSAERDVTLRVSRFAFTPTTGRFEFLVRNGFPSPANCGPWHDDEIDEALLGGLRRAA